MQPRLAAFCARHEGMARRLSIWVALYTIPLLLSLRPVLDPDIWWHLRTGQWIVEHRAVPSVDPFSHHSQDNPWVAYSWLFEVLLFSLYHWSGLRGVLLYRILLLLLVVVVLHNLVAKRQRSFLLATTLTGLALLALLPLGNERPWLFTILFFTITLDIVLDYRAGKRSSAIWLLPPLYGLWANLHIQFVYGLLLLILACLEPHLERLICQRAPGKAGTPANWRAQGSLPVISLGCFVATLLNPYGLELYRPVLEYGLHTGAYRYVQELTALDFRSPSDWAVLALTGLALFALGRQRRPRPFEITLLIAAACFAFRTRRDVWFVVVVAASILASQDAIKTPTDFFAPTKLRKLLAIAGVLLVIPVIARARGLSEAYLQRKLAESYPVSATAVVEERGYTGPLYNHFDWGGYLIWRLPRLAVAMDGRTNLHGDARIERSLRTWSGGAGWTSDPELAAAQLVIAPVDWPLTTLLRHDRRFQIVYEDAVAVVFIAPS